ncbi:phthiocerol/phthiodiolone dimycocerosyl transferase family protein [Rhodoferax sp.]|uniref:phthiocerol/phthiodiolone dimycocerosyl transferase family protein n=1 Tax=Rhodoferax sp. TaxID=50421 RepID=UPI00284515D9|nr:condensation domain-containing protein [Rhodoferax sp.]MDR3370898.1 condensation domain-containing protein [Rhodoferax sp.]
MISRPLDPGEAFFFLSDQVSCMNFVVLAERTGPLETARIRRALDIVQQENALLQTRIRWTEEDGLRFEPAPGQAFELICHQVAAQNWHSVIEQELSKPFPLESAPLMRCLYLEVQAAHASTATSCVLALTFHHSVADGRSGTEILRRMLSLMAQAATALVHGQITHLPTMTELMPAHYRWAEQPEAARQLRNTLLTDYRRHGVLPVMPWLATEAAGREPRLIRLQLDAQTSQALIGQARANNSTLHGALCAAQLLAQFKLQQTNAPTPFFLSCPVDLRPHLEGTPPISPTGFFTSLISGTFQTGPDTDPWELAREVISQTRLQIARGEGHLLYHLYGLDGSPVPPQAMEPFRKKALASFPNTMVSNIGAVALVADDPAVQAISFALCPMSYQTLFTAASSYNGRLLLNIGYDAERLTETTAQALARGIHDILLVMSKNAR